MPVMAAFSHIFGRRVESVSQPAQAGSLAALS
jgi:hypothetical protein